MKNFILWLAKIFKVNVIDGSFIEKRGNDVFIKGDLKVSGSVTMYSINAEELNND